MNPEKKITSYAFSDTIVLLANGNGTINFLVDASWKFVAMGWTYAATDIFSLQILDSDRKIFSNFIPAQAYQGIYATSRVLFTFNKFHPKGYMFNPASNIVVNLRDTSGSSNTVQIIIDGYRIAV